MPESDLAGSSQSRPPCLTFEALRDSGQNIVSSRALQRVYKWFMSPSWEDDIFVTEPSASGEIYGYRPVRRYFDRETDKLHDIAQESISEPKVSAVTVSVGNFNHLEQEFDANHADCFLHYDDDDDEETCIRFLLKSDRERVELPANYDPNDPNRPAIHHLKKLKCCHQYRPTNYEKSIRIECNPQGPGFVTVHEYITTVHPWLRGLELQLLDADRVHDYEGSVYEAPLFEDMRVNTHKVDEIFVQPSFLKPMTNIISSSADAAAVEAAEKRCVREMEEARSRILQMPRP